MIEKHWQSANRSSFSTTATNLTRRSGRSRVEPHCGTKGADMRLLRGIPTNEPSLSRSLRDRSDARQPRLGVAKPFELYAHPVHNRQVQAAQLAVVVALVGVVDDPAGLEAAAQAAGQQ